MLKALWDNFMQVRFPPSGKEERTRDLHDDLINWEMFAAGAVTSLLAGDKLTDLDEQYLEYEESIEQRAREIAEEGGPDRPVAEQYLNYLALWDRILAVAKALQAQRRGD